MKTTNKQHKNIDNTQCTHFEKTKLCAFILASFKKVIDCIMIEIPLKDTIPVAIIKELFSGTIDKCFEPLVTSKIP